MDAALSPAAKETDKSEEMKSEVTLKESDDATVAVGNKTTVVNKGEGEEEGMEVEGEKEKDVSEAEKKVEGGGEGGGGGGREKEEKKEPEPEFEMLSNPARVLPQQVRTYMYHTHMK